MSTFVLVVALGSLAASVAFFVAARISRADAASLYREAHNCLKDARAVVDSTDCIDAGAIIAAIRRHERATGQAVLR